MPPQGKFLSKQHILRRTGPSVGMDLQYIQVKSLFNKIYHTENLIHPLEDFEKLLIQPEQKCLISKLYKLLIGKISVVDIARLKWQKDLQVTISDTTCSYISTVSVFKK